MNYIWKNYLSENEKVEVDFGVSNLYSGILLAIATLIAVVISFSNIFVGLGILLLGIVYWFYLTRGKRYAFTNRRIIAIDVSLGKSVTNIEYDKITDISIDQNVFEMMGGWGTIIINTAGSDNPEAILQFVQNPQKIKNELDKLALASKKS
jgi:hypothetical protein